MRPWRWLITTFLFVQPVWAGPEVAFSPEVVVMPEVAVGDTTSARVVVANVGDANLIVSRLGFAKGRKTAFEALPSQFEIAPGDSMGIQIAFKPQSGGAHTDALVLTTNKTFEDVSQPIPAVAVTGRVVSPEIALSASRLTFASSGIGKAVTHQIRVANVGADVLRVLRASVADRRFQVDATAFDVAASGSRTLAITYTPDSSRARTDSLVLESNDVDERRVSVFLDAFGTPRNEGRARLSIVRSDTIKYPAVGDVISADVILHTHQDSVGGLEVYVGYNPDFFQSARPDSPFVRMGLTRDSLQVVKNTLVTADSGRRAVYLSAVTATKGRRVLDGVVARLRFVVVAPLLTQTRLRTLTDITRLNSIYTTPGGRAFTLPGSGGLIFGNTPAVFLNLPLIQTQEDRAVRLRLGSVATDEESLARNLLWDFQEPTGVLSIALITEDTTRKVELKPPPNGWGTYPVMAVVADSAGGRDTTSIIVQVAPVNDAPSTPVLLAPSQGADSLGLPVSFVWQASDVDRGDTLTFNFRLAQDSLSLAPVQTGLRDALLVVQDLVVGQRYFWQISARDKMGVSTRSPIWSFTMARQADAGVRFVGDMNGDLIVGFADFILFTHAYGTMKGHLKFDSQADLNQDDQINFADFVVFAQLFGTRYSTS